MKKISVHGNTIIRNRHYKAGEHDEADIPVEDLDELLKKGFAAITGDAPSAPVNADMSPNDGAAVPDPQGLFPSEAPGEGPAAGGDTADALLAKSVKEIREALPRISDGGLENLWGKETVGKGRKSVLDAIAAEFDRRAAMAAGDDAE